MEVELGLDVLGKGRQELLNGLLGLRVTLVSFVLPVLALVLATTVLAATLLGSTTLSTATSVLLSLAALVLGNEFVEAIRVTL